MEFIFSASETCFAPSAPMLLSSILRARAERRRQGLLTVGKETCGGVLEFDQDRILLEVVCKQHGVPNFEAITREVRLCLVSLDTTERCKLRFAFCDIQNGLCTVLANVVSQQAANES